MRQKPLDLSKNKHIADGRGIVYRVDQRNVGSQLYVVRVSDGRRMLLSRTYIHANMKNVRAPRKPKAPPVVATEPAKTAAGETNTEAGRINQLFASMPFGANCGFVYPETVDPVAIADNLERLSERLSQIAQRTQATEDEWLQTKRDIEAAGRVFRQILGAVLPQEKS